MNHYFQKTLAMQVARVTQRLLFFLYPYLSYLAFKAAFNLILITVLLFFPFSAVTLLVGRQEGHPAWVKSWVLVC